MSQANKKNMPQGDAAAAEKGRVFRSYEDALKASGRKNDKSAGPAGSAQSGHSHKVEVVEEQGLVKRIKVTCQCGELIEIDCSYEEK